MKGVRLMKYVGVTTLALLAATAISKPTDVSAYELDYPTQEEIRQKYYEIEFSALKDIEYTKDYSTKKPYDMGDISFDDRIQALNSVNFCRYLAGLPADITLNDSYNETTQAASLVNASNGILTHYPSQPSEMSDELYKLGSNGARSSNIASGFSNITSSVIDGYVADTDASNIDRVGHRRWVLNPAMKQTGFGFVENYTAMYAFDRTRSDTFTGDYVAWPPKNMPNEIYTQSSYGYAFSVSLNSSYEYPSLENITVDLSSKLLNKSWRLDKTSTDMKTNYLTVNNDGYGMNRCIIFNVGQFPENDTVSVKINGLKRNGVPTSISYTVNFFNLFDEDSQYNKLGFKEDNYTVCVGDTIPIVPYNNPLKTLNFSWSLSGDYRSFDYYLSSGKLFIKAKDLGTMRVYATYNGVTYTTDITAVCKHDYKLISATAASCTKEGSKSYTCSICGETKIETIPKTAHSYSKDWTIDVEPTAKSEGSKSHHCTVCGDKTDITAIPKLSQPLVNTSKISATSITLGDSIKLTAGATGGTAPYKYIYYCRPEGDSKWIALTRTTTNTTVTKRPAKAAKYNFAVKVTDAQGKSIRKYFTVIVNAPLSNNSTISATNIMLGDSVKLTANAIGGTAPYKYRFYCRIAGNSKWTALTGTTTNTTVTKKPAKATDYEFAVRIIDANGKYVTKYFTVTVNAPLANNSTISATSIKLGDTVTLNAKATGGTAPYKYRYYCRAEDDSKWTALTGTTTNTTVTKKLEKATNYEFAIKVIDADGKTVRKSFKVTVTK
ncbi:MAG: CAP domain-containing protein [Candidatus Pseudoruminococcus sp.]|nr:CAP domain-containing protein [Candidatus Pseudoruminococcus sp.]